MNEKELRKLSRMDLLELLIMEGKKNRQLQEEIEKLKEELQNKQILIRESGSIAEAALKLNGVFEAAEAAAKQYLENISRVEERMDKIKK